MAPTLALPQRMTPTSLALSATTTRLLCPILLLFQLLSKIVLAPPFVVWLQVGAPCRLAFAVFIAFFPLRIATVAGLAAPDQGALALCRGLGAARWQTLLMVRLPFAVPHLLAGLKTAATLALLGIVIGEFVTAQRGLGHLVLLAGNIAETALMLAAIVMLLAIGTALHGTVLLLEAAFALVWYAGDRGKVRLMPASLPPLRVSLPMYNLPEMQAVNTAFWQAIRTELKTLGIDGAPDTPDFARKPVPGAIEPDTLFTQVCGWPLQTVYPGQATILGIPVYDAPACDGPRHAGVFVVARASRYTALADLRGCDFVFNSLQSNSGMNLPRRAIADIANGQPFFARITETHSQPANLERVVQGDADATCVDCVTYAFFARHRPALAARLRILAPTPPSPAIPFVTAASTAPETTVALITALARVAKAPQWAQARSGLLIRDIVAPDQVDYRVQLTYTDEAAALGYPVLQ